MNRLLAAAAAAITLASCSPPAATPPASAPAQNTPAATEATPGAYTLDKAHSSLITRVDHLSFSKFTGRFARWDAQLQLDPSHPEQAQLTVTIDPASFEADNPPPGFLDLLHGPQFFDVRQFPQMGFRSTSIELTGANTARITGDLTLHGVTRPVTLDATFNGGYAGNQFDRNARVGFSAHGVLQRSAFNMGYGVPPPGTTMGVGDEVEFVIETEFTGPAWTPSAEP